ncbi:hypothetical protein OCU04_013089 [Sclerotinia nivalis]|uniref:Uncharacterized protein n=1 Tax=Sclerotinia nivalis TaxID=352851 RepID=A0A9X0A7Z4_9HELO|nr:hypothetical protein OCU04_013089 [Sclerotinia nivalis]
MVLLFTEIQSFETYIYRTQFVDISSPRFYYSKSVQILEKILAIDLPGIQLSRRSTDNIFLTPKNTLCCRLVYDFSLQSCTLSRVFGCMSYRFIFLVLPYFELHIGTFEDLSISDDVPLGQMTKR